MEEIEKGHKLYKNNSVAHLHKEKQEIETDRETETDRDGERQIETGSVKEKNRQIDKKYLKPS